MKIFLDQRRSALVNAPKLRLTFVGSLILALFLFAISIAQAWNNNAQNITSSPHGAYYPSIWTDPSNETSHVIWGQDNGAGSWIINYESIVNGSVSQALKISGEFNARPYDLPEGVNFDPDKAIGGNFNFREQSRIVGLGNHLFVVFQAYPAGGGCCADIYFTESTDDGAHWTDAALLSPVHTNDNKHRYTPAMAVLPNGDVYVVYNKANEAIELRKRANGNNDWTAEAGITKGVGSAPRFPNIAYTIDGAKTFLHVTISAGSGNDSLYYTKSTDGGSSWSSAVVISNNPNTSKRNTIATDLVNNVYVVYADSNSQGPIKFNHSPDNGSSWDGPSNIATSDASYANLAYESAGVLDLVFQVGFDSGSTIAYYKYNGSSWHSKSAPDGGTCGGKAPAISIGTSTMNTVFHAKISGCTGNWDIFFNTQAASGGGGATPTPTATPPQTNTPTVTPTGTITPTATPPSEGKKYNNDAPDITYTGTWTVKTSSLSCLVKGDFAQASKDTGNTASLTFNGTIIKYFYVKKSSFGSADVYIDGNLVATRDESGDFNCKGFKSEPLAPGQHTILVRPSADSNGDITLDAFKVVP